MTRNKALEHAIGEAQRITHNAWLELSSEAKQMMKEARETGSERLALLGAELVKLGERIEKLAHKPVVKKAIVRRKATPTARA